MSETDSEVEELLQTLVEVDRRAAVWCACQCARTVLHLVAEGDHRPLHAINTAEAWTRGETTREERSEVYLNALDAIDTTEASASAAATAATAAFAVDENPFNIDEAPFHAAEAVRAAAPNRQPGAYSRHLAHLHDLVSAIRWPLTTTVPVKLLEAAAAIQVVWDLVATEPRTDHTIVELIEAHARAQRLGLDWTDPVQRAVAERATDEERVRQLLGREEPRKGPEEEKNPAPEEP